MASTSSNCEKPEIFIDDPLTDILRKGARKLLVEALEVEIEIFLSHYADLKDRCGRQRICYSPSLLPPYLRRTKSMEELIPWRYLKGVSTGDFSEALAALVGKDAPGLSPATISRLKSVWQDELDQWQKRDLSGKRYAYIWADGIYCNVRMEEKQCPLVIIGATADGTKA